jgi:hypothetical protein
MVLLAGLVMSTIDSCLICQVFNHIAQQFDWHLNPPLLCSLPCPLALASSQRRGIPLERLVPKTDSLARRRQNLATFFD